MAAAERARRDSQRAAVLFLIMRLLTAFPSALLTARICSAAASPFLESIAWRAFLIRVLILDLTSMLRSRALRLWRCLFKAEGWTIKAIPPINLVISNISHERSQRCSRWAWHRRAKGPGKILLSWDLLHVPGCVRYLPPEPRRAIPGRPLNGSVEAELDRRKCGLLMLRYICPSFENKLQLAEIPCF